MKITLLDRKSYAVSSARVYTDEGFLRVPGHVARTGVQEYLAGELGLTGRNPNDVIRVNRDASEVFSQESLASYAGADVTIQHPTEMVDINTHKMVSVGTVAGPGIRDGERVKIDIIIKNKDGIEAVEKGLVELSSGYSAVYDDNVPKGADYEFDQRNIKINHVALVDTARAGALARLFDHKMKVNEMFKITLDSGRVVEVADAAIAALIEDSLKTMNEKLVAATATAEKATAAKDAAIAALDEEKKLSSDEAIANRLSTLTAVKDGARIIAGDDFTTDSLEVAEIQRVALLTANPNRDWKDKSDIYIQAAFDMELEKKENEDDDDEDEGDKKGDKKGKKTAEQLAKIAKDAAHNSNDTVSAHATFTANLNDSWKSTVGVK